MPEYTFKLPDIGEGIAEAEIAAWHVAVGDDVGEDDPLVDMLTDKANVELTTPVAGRVVSLSGAVGDLIATGSPLVVLATEGAAIVADSVEPDIPAAPAAAPPPERPAPAPITPASDASDPDAREDTTKDGGAPQPVVARPSASVVTYAGGRAPLAAPAVRQRAEELGVDLSLVHTTNPNGRIRHADLAAYLAYLPGAQAGAAAAAGPVPDVIDAVRVVGLRRRIAERMSESKRRIPHFSYVEEVDVTDLEAMRTQINEVAGRDGPKLNVLPFLIRALVGVLPAFPQINARYDDDNGVVERHSSVHVGIAAQTPGGLVVPVIRDAQALDLRALATEILRLATAARDGRATASELGGSTITISSLGPLGGLATTPVINHPEVGIIGVNKIIERAVVRDGAIVVRRMMNLSCSFDHRVVDGQDAAEFVQALRGALERPATTFVR